MALNNRGRINRAFELLQEGLHDFVDEVMTRYFHTSDWPERMAAQDAQRYGRERRRLEKTDPQVQLRAITGAGAGAGRRQGGPALPAGTRLKGPDQGNSP